MNADLYFLDHDEWDTFHTVTAQDRLGVEMVAGRILDVGAGAGRHALELQQLGHEVVPLDVSPGAIEVCRDRGVDKLFLGTTEDLVREGPELFDAVILLGQNLALLESPQASGPFLDSLRSLLKPDGMVIGNTLDVYQTEDPTHLAYHKMNRERGRSPGQLTLRIKFEGVVGGWFDYLFLSPTELDDVAERAGWRVEELTEPNPSYLAVPRPA
jgi:2-polyprenyl-3-methyl-5-hydroxy-6-metoxy-1,4-benzoquinol methylase